MHVGYPKRLLCFASHPSATLPQDSSNHDLCAYHTQARQDKVATTWIFTNNLHFQLHTSPGLARRFVIIHPVNSIHTKRIEHNGYNLLADCTRIAHTHARTRLAASGRRYGRIPSHLSHRIAGSSKVSKRSDVLASEEKQMRLS